MSVRHAGLASIDIAEWRHNESGPGSATNTVRGLTHSTALDSEGLAMEPTHGPTARRCAMDACHRPVRSRGLCERHYRRARYAGTIGQHALVHPEHELPVAERFWSQVDAGGVCWEWTGRVNEFGYGTIRQDYAHRWAWTHLVGPITEGMTLDHLCRNRRCVNPDHLEEVTRSENSRRAFAHMRASTTCRRGHDLTVHAYIRPDTGRRMCRACNRHRWREAAAKAPKMSRSRRLDRWSRHHAACVVCHSTERPHTAHGLCNRCYLRVRGGRK